MQTTYTAIELLTLSLPCLPKTQRGIRLLSDSEHENWPHTWIKVRGQSTKAYIAHLLPQEVRQGILNLSEVKALVATSTPLSDRTAPLSDRTAPLSDRTAPLSDRTTPLSDRTAPLSDRTTPLSDRTPPPLLAPLNQAQTDKAMAKADLLRHYLRTKAVAPWGKKDQAREGFMQAYNSGLSYPRLFAALGEVSWQAIEGWKSKLRKHKDAFALADRRGSVRKGNSGLNSMQTDILLACVLRPNKPRISESIRLASSIMETKGIVNVHSESSYRRWLDRWIETNTHIWVFNREGAKAWNDKCAYYIERDLNLVNVGDVIIADGHNLNFEIINPWTGKRQNHMTLVLFFDMRSSYPLGWEIMPTENTQSISSALRRAIIRLGKIPQVVYLDNGRAFKSRFFQGSADFEEDGYAGLYGRLGIKTIFAWPYHGQSKPIERFFGTFAEVERLNALSYTGTSIEDKPPRMMRGEKLHRKVHEKAFGGRCLTMAEAHLLVASWFDEYANRQQTRSSHLQGLRPGDVFQEGRGPGVDVQTLEFLMMSVEVKTIHRNGITFQGRNYYDPALHGRQLKQERKVVIRYDLQDSSYLLVYDDSGAFICRATPTQKMHPAAAHLGSEADVQQLTKQIEFKKHQEKEASASAREFLRDVVLVEHQRQLDGIGIKGQVIEIGPSSPERSRRAVGGETGNERGDAPTEAPALTATDCEEIMAEVEELQRDQCQYQAEQLNLELENMSEPERFQRLLSIEMQGQLVPKRWQNFMRYYEEVIDQAGDWEYWESVKASLAIMYGKALTPALSLGERGR